MRPGRPPFRLIQLRILCGYTCIRSCVPPGGEPFSPSDVRRACPGPPKCCPTAVLRANPTCNLLDEGQRPTPHVHYEKLLLRLKPWEHQASADVDCPTIQGGTNGLALATGPAEGP